MLVPGILGFQGILVVCLLVFCIVIRQKWRNAMVRKAEITNLLAVAAEESFMVEVEAAKQYNSIPSLYQCAVCFCPTTTRCSRCKAVRYCSSKCQIIHWREGHKDACCPLNTIMPLQEESNFVVAAASEKQFESCGNDSKIEGISKVSSKAASMMDDYSNLKPFADAEGTHTGFASSGIKSVVGFRSSRAISASEISGSSNIDLPSNIERPERPSADAVNPDIPGTRTRTKKTKQTMSPSSETINSVVNVGGTSRASKSHKLKLSHNDEEVNFRSQLPNGKTTISDDVQPVKSGDKKPIGGAASSELLVKDTSKSRRSSSVNCSRSDTVDKDGKDDSLLSKGEDVRSLSFSAPRTFSATAGQSLTISKCVRPTKISSVPSLPQNACRGLKTSMQKVVQQFRVSKPLKSHILGSENEVAEKYNDKTIFPYDLFMKLYSYDEVELFPFGLTNCGNSCYANAVLQCLAFTRPLISYLVQRLHSRACRKKEWCFICEFEHLIQKAREGNSPVSPIGILSKIQKIGSHLGHGREEDAHEFLRCAVDTMQSVCLKEAGAKGKLAEETTLVGLTFGGYLLSKIKCLKCLSKSERCERMMDLTVEIDGDIETLEDALAQFTATETLVGENKYHCNRCKSYEKAKKKLTILEEPNILTIVLKRFQSGNFGKLNKSVRFPEVLKMAPYMSETSGGYPVYGLYAVVVHLDAMNAAYSGHYVCYVKDSCGDWFRIDDNNVMPVELEKVLLEEAYMLLYARHSPRPAALMRNNVVSQCVKSNRRNLEAVPSGPNASKLRSNSNIPSVDSKAQQKLSFTSNQVFDRDEWRYHSMQRTPTVDSSSESSSIFSWSDASSCSTASTKDSSRSEDLSDFIFGEMGPNWYSRYGIPSDSVASSSHRNLDTDSEVENEAWRRDRRDGSRQDGNHSILYTDSTKHCQNLSRQFVSNSSKGIDSDQVVWANPYDVRLRRASGNRSAQTFY